MQAAAERRNWKKFGEAVHEKAGDSVTVRATEDIPFERVRLAKTTQEQKTQMDVASALAAGDKAAVGTRCVVQSFRLALLNGVLVWRQPFCYSRRRLPA